MQENLNSPSCYLIFTASEAKTITNKALTEKITEKLKPEIDQNEPTLRGIKTTVKMIRQAIQILLPLCNNDSFIVVPLNDVNPNKIKAEDIDIFMFDNSSSALSAGFIHRRMCGTMALEPMIEISTSLGVYNILRS